jgi:hypothetical protein
VHARGLGEKDLSLALELGGVLDVDLPLAELALKNLAAGLGVPHTASSADALRASGSSTSKE